jgi:hypothetical protein
MQEPRVVELFTSQGCPKCPPADRLIGELAARPDTIALSFAVNYWDYIGWRDTLASPAFTARQNAYAAARGDRQVFTPQAIVDGQAVEAGADRSAILRDLEADRGRPTVPVSIGETRGWLHVRISDGPTSRDRPAGVYLLRVMRAKTVRIGRGENSGQSVTYTNVVRALNRLGDWAGHSVSFDTLDLRGDGEGYVVLVQGEADGRPGPILGAAQTPDLAKHPEHGQPPTAPDLAE